jgi:TetR/AcrR family transcriptional regulator, tetracycline repressor protein
MYRNSCVRAMPPPLPTAPKTGRPRRLAANQVVAEARRIGADEGAEALTMRRLADALGVLPNALYTYFSDKLSILDAVLDDLIGDVERPDPNASPRRGLVSLMASYRNLLLTQPGLIALTVSRPQIGPKAIRLREDGLTLLKRGGLSDADAVRAYMTLFAYTAGFVAFEAGRPAGERDLEQRADVRKIHESLPADGFPTTRALAKRLAKRPGDAEFTYGLERLLDGFGVTRPPTAPSARAAPRGPRQASD